MINTDLIDVINSGRAWAFIGSGISVDAGSLTWKVLLERILDRIVADNRKKIEGQSKFTRALKKDDFPACFSVIESYIGRNPLEHFTASELNKTRLAGKLTQSIAELPFQSFITTNYDSLIENALEQLEQPGWVPVGNTEEEAKKLSGDASNVVWHVHGSLDLDKSKSRLILTENDYDSIYLQESPIYEQLKSVLAQHRIVFLGFSFQDADVKRLLKLVGNLCTPDRPAYAFLSDISGSEHYQERMDLRLKHNIEVIPYDTVASSHHRLHELLSVYESMILTRKLRFGRTLREIPSYTEEATGLLLFNELNLKRHEGFSTAISNSLLRSRILSILRSRKKIKVIDILADLNERLRLLQSGSKSKDEIKLGTNETIKELVGAELLKYDEKDGSISLTDKGTRLVSGQSGIAERIYDQFMASLQSRARKVHTLDSGTAQRVANLAGAFIRESIRKHSLGVALVQNNPSKPQQEYQMVALLRSFPEYIEQATSEEEATALIHLIQDILSAPNEVEKKYIGLSLQAQFGVHLLGLDRSTIQLRVEQTQKTLFLIDSSTLIPFLARSCIGHDSAKKVLALLKENGGAVVTTAYLSAEVSEHACWAINNVGKTTETFKTYAVSMGQAGFGSNAFLEGFLEEVKIGKTPPDINNYLMGVCNKRADVKLCSDDDIIRTLKRHSLPVKNLSEWDGFSTELYGVRQEYAEQIASLRKDAGNFKHNRQVRAEAEALIIVQEFREKSFRYEDKMIDDAFFVSNTRIINQLDSGGRPITMNADAIIPLLSTMTHQDPMELGFLYEGMLWELHEKGFAILDKSRIRSVFAPLIHASKAKLQELMEDHKSLIAELYGAKPEKAFKEADDLYIPIILESIQSRRAEILEEELIRERQLRHKALAKAELSEKERKELSALRLERDRRKAKGKSQKRAAQSRKKRKKKSKK